LVRSLEAARNFRGSLVIVHGPPGIGKTRLIDGALAKACVSNRRIRRTFLEPRHTENPYKAILSLARWAARLEEIAPALDSGSLVLAPFMRAIASGAGGRGADRAAAHGQDPDGSPASEYRRLVADLEFYKRGVEAWGERSRFLHEVGWMILDAAARRHVVWIVESAQYVDPHSLTVIRYLASCLDENPLVIWLNVDTPEDGQLPKALASLLDGPRAGSVAVPRLSRQGVMEVLGWKYPSQVFADRIVDSVLKESHGLLLTVEQLANDPNVLRSSVPPPADDGIDALGVGLRKFEGLPSSARGLIEQLAVMGGETSLEMAVRLVRRDESEVRRDLASLVTAGLLLEQESGTYCFRLTGLSGEIEARLPEGRLRVLHREAAEALEASTSGFEERIFDLERHWRKAEVWEAAAHASLVAARFSSDSFAPEGGLLYAQRALDAARLLTDRQTPLEAEALVEQGRALYDLGRLHESLGTLREAVASIGAGPNVWPFRARALFYLARALSSLARPQEALEIVQEASTALAQVDDARARLMLHQVIGVAFMMSDQNREAVEHFRSMLSIAQTLGDAREISYAQKNLSAVLLALDPHDEEGWRLVNSALEHHTRTNNFAGLAAGYLNRSLTKLELKDSEGALKDLARSRQAAELAHAPLLLASATLQEVAVLLDRLDVDHAEGLLKALAPWMPAMEEPWARVSFSLLMGRVAEARHLTDEADRLYEEATLLAEPGGESSALWECRLRRAALAKRLGALERFQSLREALPSREEICKVAPALAILREELEAQAS
jgi:tetratricopeptide (TPR) repeat protein